MKRLELNQLKNVQILGREFNIEYVGEMFDLDGYVKCNDKSIHIRKGLKEERETQVTWHEIIHAIDNFITIRQDGKRLTEEEVDRLAFALSTLKVDYLITDTYSGDTQGERQLP